MNSGTKYLPKQNCPVRQQFISTSPRLMKSRWIPEIYRNDPTIERKKKREKSLYST